jgi:hypothetical protein
MRYLTTLLLLLLLGLLLLPLLLSGGGGAIITSATTRTESYLQPLQCIVARESRGYTYTHARWPHAQPRVH